MEILVNDEKLCIKAFHDAERKRFRKATLIFFSLFAFIFYFASDESFLIVFLLLVPVFTLGSFIRSNTFLLDEEILIIKDEIFLLRYKKGNIKKTYRLSIYDIEKISYDDGIISNLIRMNGKVAGWSQNKYRLMKIKTSRKVYSFGYKLGKKEFFEINNAISQYISDYKKKFIESNEKCDPSSKN